MSGRADPFADDFDVSAFKPARPSAKTNPEAVRRLAEDAAFPSREAPRPLRRLQGLQKCAPRGGSTARVGVRSSLARPIRSL
jgi:hypothetical protein